jgi:hypothetical protein
VPSTRSDAAAILAAIERGEVEPLYLIAGEPVLALPCAERVASALAQRSGAVARTVRRPPRLADLLQDLRTYSLFESAKVVVAVETALFADRQAAADLVDQAAEVASRGRGALRERERRRFAPAPGAAALRPRSQRRAAGAPARRTTRLGLSGRSRLPAETRAAAARQETGRRAA